MTTLERIRAAFDGDSVHEKDVALRMAHDEIAAMDAEIRRLREQNNAAEAQSAAASIANKFARQSAEAELEIGRLREQIDDLTTKSRNYVEKIEDLKELLDDRDGFIRIRGLWEDFVATAGG